MASSVSGGQSRSGARITRWLASQLRRGADALWPLAQQTAGAVIAWLIAVLLTGQPDPLFAPMAAVIALNAALGRRGSNAVRLVVGVVVGVVVAEVAVWLIGGGLVTLAVTSPPWSSHNASTQPGSSRPRRR
jgi:hypothetical protein